MINFKLDIGPVALARPRFMRQTGIAYTSPKSRRFKKEFSELVEHLWRVKRYPVLDGPLEAKINFLIAKPKSTKRDFPTVKPDIDNYLKAVLDAMNGICYVDDSRIISIYGKKLYGPSGSIEVTLSKITGSC